MYKEIVIDYLKKKDKIIYDLTDIHYVSLEDIKDIEELLCEEMAICFCASVEIYMSSPSYRKDSNMCIWCWLTNTDCSVCSYGKRNSICDENNSTYMKIRDSLWREDQIINYKPIFQLTKDIFCKKL